MDACVGVAKLVNSDIPERMVQRLPWHRPELQRLTVHVDTAAGAASDIEGQGSIGVLKV